MTQIEIPPQFQRNSAKVLALGLEKTGCLLLDRANALLGWPDLADKDLLDVGCGVRFTQTIINRAVAIGSYTGVEIDASLVRYLSDHVADDRFAFHHWDVRNAMYNPGGEKLTTATRPPFLRGRRFDAIWLYSVLTHTAPQDSASLLRILRRHVKPGGALLFSAFVDDTIDTFEDRLKDQPLMHAFYSEKFLRRLAHAAGWRVETRFDGWTDVVMQTLFVCRPRVRLWPW